MDEDNTAESSNWWGDWNNFLIELQPQQLIQIVMAGAIVGLAEWLLTLLVRQAVMVPLFCGDPSSAPCMGATGTAGIVATIIAGVIGLMGLVRIGAFRPLLIVIAALITLWGLSGWVSDLPWFPALLLSAVLYALVYATFAWFARIRPFIPAAIVVVIVVILARTLSLL